MTPAADPLPLGPVSGRRGTAGEITVRVVSGEAGRWAGLDVVLLGSGAADPGASPARAIVEEGRAYGDKLVLKLQGVDDAGAAVALKGRWVFVPADRVPPLPEGQHWVARLIGLCVEDDSGAPIGRVRDVVETGGTDLLEVVDDRGKKHLIPMAREIVIAIDERFGRIRVRPPDGLMDLGG